MLKFSLISINSDNFICSLYELIEMIKLSLNFIMLNKSSRSFIKRLKINKNVYNFHMLELFLTNKLPFPKVTLCNYYSLSIIRKSIYSTKHQVIQQAATKFHQFPIPCHLTILLIFDDYIPPKSLVSVFFSVIHLWTIDALYSIDNNIIQLF